jgi:hypothetical protein
VSTNGDGPVPVVSFQAIARNLLILSVVDSSHNSGNTPFRIRVKTAVVHRRKWTILEH